jgi:hypothetical protein
VIGVDGDAQVRCESFPIQKPGLHQTPLPNGALIDMRKGMTALYAE